MVMEYPVMLERIKYPKQKDGKLILIATGSSFATIVSMADQSNNSRSKNTILSKALCPRHCVDGWHH